MRQYSRAFGPLSAFLCACGDGGGGVGDGSTDESSVSISVTAGETGPGTGVTAGTETLDGGTAVVDDTTADSTGSQIKFDMAPVPDSGSTVDMCAVVDDMNAVGPCRMTAPPDAFEPELQWSFTDPAEPYSYVTPLVANFTDDNGDGAIDLCDTPDVVLVAGANPGSPAAPAHIFLLDGGTGALLLRIDDAVDSSFTPAIGDIDGDGLVEIVTTSVAGNLVAFENDGTLKWSQPATWDIADFFGQDLRYSGSAALADVDNDGDVEIITANLLFDHDGELLQHFPIIAGIWGATTAADLDGDGDLEIVLGNAALHHDGGVLWQTGLEAGYPQVADLDDDGLPEVVLTNFQGLSLIEHDGSITYSNLRPTGVPAAGTNWLRAAAIHDFDGDGAAEYAMSSASQYTVYEADASILWTANVADGSGIASGTAFDFVAAGQAQAMYADEQFLYVYDGEGAVLLQQSRQSGTLSEYPVVADIDNDGSAEILVVSNNFSGGGDPCIQAIRDAEDRWIAARRIWNQHTYHVTNVREDGTIPQFEPPSWEGLNTFRTNAQIEGGGLCMPPPAG
jgi:hypothetical protein